MRPIPQSFRAHLSSTLLGRLKLTLFKKITGSPEQLPAAQQVRLFLIDQYRSNSLLGALLGGLLNHNHSQLVPYDALPTQDNFKEVLLLLEETPLNEPFFLEISNCPEPWPNFLGIFGYQEELTDGGRVYSVVLLDEKSFPDELISYVEVRASQIAPEPAFAVFHGGVYETFSQQDFEQDAIALIIAQSLRYIEKNRFKFFIPFDEAKNAPLKERQDVKPSSDKRFQILLKLVILGKIKCTEAQADLSLIKPHDINFAMSYPLDVVNQSVRMIEDGLIDRLFVYWHDNSFVMSDNYPFYLAFRKMEYTRVPVVIMGPFPKAIVEVERVGGKELIPPIIVVPDENQESLPAELKEFILDNKLHERPVSDAVFSLYSFFLDLARLVQNPQTKERQLHNLLLHNPIALDAFGVRVRTEIWLGKKYRVDLILQYEFLDKRILLVELERANIPIFTRQGRMRAKVGHAIQQVEDWLQWWRENPTLIPDGLDRAMPVEGLVVIGQSAFMNEEEKKRLISLNSTRQIQVITYDDLLGRIKNLIINLERANNR